MLGPTYLNGLNKGRQQGTMFLIKQDQT